MEPNDDYLGYLEYHGKLVSDGIMDARKSAQALLGFDAAVRHFSALQYPLLKEYDYELPVAIRPGSWQTWLVNMAKFVAIAYVSGAAMKMAANDFKDISLQKVLKNSLRSIQWLLRIGKHLGSLPQKPFEDVRWRNENTEIGIPNDTGAYLFVPKYMIDAYVVTSPRLLSNIAAIVENERELRIVVCLPNGNETETLTLKDKSIFYVSEEEGDLLFPELEHGQNVALEGIVTRGNENTNSIGFSYQNHILNCQPRNGSIVRFKHALFLKCRIIGTIDRTDQFGKITEKKPKIIFDDIKPLERESPELSLFEK